jgi:hypothetical protein
VRCSARARQVVTTAKAVPLKLARPVDMITGEVKDFSLARQIQFAPKGAHGVAALDDARLLCGPRPKSAAGAVG